MKLNFIGATHEVTGSCTYIEACGKRFLVDFGMEQGVDYFENAKIPCPPGNIDFVLLAKCRHSILWQTQRRLLPAFAHTHTVR